MDIGEVKTVSDLRKWVVQYFPNAVVLLSDQDIIIKTGMDVATGGYLYPIKERNT
jgi:hypothetical protein